MLPSASVGGLSPQRRTGRPGPGSGLAYTSWSTARRPTSPGPASPIRLGMIGSVAMSFEYGVGRPDLASGIDQACAAAISGGVRTPDLGGSPPRWR